jgi:hypothetical protein
LLVTYGLPGAVFAAEDGGGLDASSEIASPVRQGVTGVIARGIETLGVTSAAAPVVVKPAGDSVYARSAQAKLYIQASSPDGGYLTYQWFRSAKQTSAISHPGGVYSSSSLTTIKTGATDLNADQATLSTRTPDAAGYYYYWCTVTNHVEGDDGLMHTASVDTRPAQVRVLDEIVADTFTVGGKRDDGTPYTSSDYNTYYLGFNQLFTQIHNGDFEGADGNGSSTRARPISSLAPGDSDRQTHLMGYWDTTHYYKDMETYPPTTYGLLADSRLGNYVVELSAYVESSLYEELATVPGKIYEWSLDHSKRENTSPAEGKTDKDILAVVIGPAAEDTTNVYPYGEVETNTLWTGSDYKSGHAPTDTLFYKVVNQLAADLAAKPGSTFDNSSTTAMQASFESAEYANKAYSTTYQGKNYYVFISVDEDNGTGNQPYDAWQHQKGSYSVPEGQGRTVFGFASIKTCGASAGTGNILDNVVFQSGSTLTLTPDNSFSGENSISVPTKAGYAYGICEVRGSATVATSGVTVTVDADGAGAGEAVAATADSSLPGNSWYASPGEGGTITFSGLIPGKTYRVAGVPVGAISPADELNTNTDPTQVLDDGYYADTTIPVSVPDTGSQMGNVSASLYDNDTKARITMVNANANVQYALLSFANNSDADPVTAPPAASWQTPTGGQMVFEGLEPNKKYMLIARPYGYSEITYAKAAETGTEVWTPVGGFTADVERTDAGETDSITLSNIGNEPAAFNTNAFEYAIYDTKTGSLSAAKDGASSLTFTGLLKESTYQVVMRPKSSGQSWADAVRVYPFAHFDIDYVNEAVMAVGADAQNTVIPTTIEYRLYANNAAQTWIGGTEAWRPGTGAEGIPLSVKPDWLTKSIFARLAELNATGVTVEYRYAEGWDGYTDDSVSPVSTLEVPVRPAGPVIDTDYEIDYQDEKLKPKAGKHVEVSTDGGDTFAAVPDEGVALSALGWTGGGGQTLVRSAATAGGSGAFASEATTQQIAARPAAPSYVRSQQDGASVKLLSLTPGKTYEWAQPMAEGQEGSADWHSFTAASSTYTDVALIYDNDSPTGLDGDYWVREAATASTFASRYQLVSTVLMAVPVDFGTPTYGYSAQTLRQSLQLINGSSDAGGDICITGVSLGGTDSSRFTLTYGGASGSVSGSVFTGAHKIAHAEEDESFSVTPITGLGAGEYAAVVTVTYFRDTDGDGVRYTAPEGATAEQLDKQTVEAGTWTATANLSLNVQPSVWDGSQIKITSAGQTAASVSFTVTGLPIGASAEASVAGGAFTAISAVDGVYTIAGLSSGSRHAVRVRAAASNNFRASEAASASLPTAYAKPEASSVLTILYSQEIVQFSAGEIPSNYVLKLNGKEVSNNASLSAAAEAAGTGHFVLSLTRVGPDSGIPASETDDLLVTGKSDAPELNATDGVVVTNTTQDDSTDGYISFFSGGIAAAFEYRPSGSSDATSGWLSVPSGATPHSLPLGNYDVRLPAQTDAFASKYLTVHIQSANASTYLDMSGGGAGATFTNPNAEVLGGDDVGQTKAVWSSAGTGIWKSKYEEFHAPVLPVASWAGHVFAGWYTDRTYTTLAPFAEDGDTAPLDAWNPGDVQVSAATSDASATYYVKWEDFTLALSGRTTRTDDEHAVFNITSNVAGSYYYAVVPDGQAAPAFDMGAAGMAIPKDTAVSIGLSDADGLGAGAYDVYVQVKDANGNLSNRLKVDLAAYAAPAVSGVSQANTVLSGGNTYAPISGTLSITFSEAADATRTDGVSIKITPVSGSGTSDYSFSLAAGSWNAGKTVLSLPYVGIEFNTTYAVQVSGLADADGNVMPAFDGTSGGAPAYGTFTSFSSPGAPTGLSAVHASATSATLSWTAPVDFGGAAVTRYEYKVADGEWIPIPNSENMTSYTITGLSPKTPRQFTLRAANAAGTGAEATFGLDAVSLTGSVSITGAPVYGSALTADTSALSTNPAGLALGTLSYEWRRHEGPEDTEGTVIGGATGATYTPVAEDIGKVITVTVSSAYAEGSKASAATGEVAKKALVLTALADDKVYDGTQAASVKSWGWSTGPVSGDEASVSVTVGTATFASAGSADADTTLAVSFTGFDLTGSKADCYTMAQPAQSVARILTGFDAEENVQYVLTERSASGWANASVYGVDAKSGYQVSGTSDADGWTSYVALGSAEGADKTNFFYVKNVATGAISRKETVTWNMDRTAPEAEITVKGNSFTTLLNSLSFGFFFKNTVDVKILSSDATSGVAKVEYLILTGDDASALSHTRDQLLTMSGWTEGSSFSVSADFTGVVYARVTDEARNVTVVSTNGLVIYTDSAAVTTSITYTKTTKTDTPFSFLLGGNEVKSVSIFEYASELPGQALTANTQYALETAGTAATVTIDGNVLDTLAAGSYVVVVVLKPAGITYAAATADPSSEAPATVEIPLTVNKKSLTDADVKWPSASGVTYGDTLSTSILSGGAAPGGAVFAWASDAAVPTVGNGGYDVTLTPSADALLTYDYSAVTMTKKVAVAVTPRQLTGSWDASGKTYDGSAAASVTFTPDNLVSPDGSDAVPGTVTAHYASGANAGTNKTIVIDSVQINSANYSAPEFPVSLKATIAKAPATAVAHEIQAAEGEEASYALSPISLFLPPQADGKSYGTVTYEPGAATDASGILKEAPAYDADAGEITLTVKDTALAGQSATIPVTIHSTNYEFAADAVLTVSIVGTAPRVLVGGPVGAGVFTGQTVSLTASVAESGLSGTWQWYKSTDDVRGNADDAAVGGADGAMAGNSGVNTAQMNADTSAAGDTWYYCVFTNNMGSSYTSLAKVAVTARSYAAVLTPAGKDFGAESYGYAEIPAQAFTLTNTGNQTLTNLTAALSGAGSSAYEITAVTVAGSSAEAGGTYSLTPGAVLSVSVRPKSGLAASGAAYGETLSFSWTDGGLSGNGSGTLTQNATLAFKVNMAAGALGIADPDAAGALTYDGQAVVPQVLTNPGAADTDAAPDSNVTWYWRANAGEATAGEAPFTQAASSADLPKNAGSWQVYASAAATDNFTAASSAVVTYVIGKKPLTITATAEDKDYDGTASATLKSGQDAPALVGVIDADTDNVTLSGGSAVFDGVGSADADKSVGVKFTGFAVGGSAAPNYSFTQPASSTATIRAGFTAEAETDYVLSLLHGGWTNGAFTVTAAGSSKISLSSSADEAGWTSGTLTLGTDETAGGVKSFYVMRADGKISKATLATWKIDKTAPAAIISLKDNKFTTLLNTVSFGLFFKETVDVKITAKDENSTANPPANSGVEKVEYLLWDAAAGTPWATAPTDGQLAASGDWQDYSDSSKPSLSPNWKGAAYARVTDTAGNVTVVSSEGVVIYTDTAASAQSVSYTRTSKESQAFALTLNDNEVKSIKLYEGSYAQAQLAEASGSAEVLSGAGGSIAGGDDYEASGGGNVTLSADWLETLAAGSYTLVVESSPLGEEYADAAGNDAPIKLVIPLTVSKAAPNISAVEANGSLPLSYGKALSAWSVTGTASGADGAAGGTFSWDDGAAIPGNDADSAENGLNPAGYTYAVTWTPSDAPGSYGSGKASDYFSPVTGLSATAFVDPATTYMAAGDAPQGSAINRASYGGTLAKSTLSGVVYYDFSGNIGSGNANGQTAAAGVWTWAAPDPSAVSYSVAGIKEEAAVFTPTDKRLSVYNADGSGGRAKAQVPVFSPTTAIIVPDSYTLSGVYGASLADVNTGVYGLDSYLKSLGFKAVEDTGSGDLSSADEIPGTFSWQAADPSSVILSASGGTQNAVLLFTPAQLAQPPYTAGSGFVTSTAEVEISLAMPALGGAVSSTSGAADNAAVYGAVLTASGEEALTLSPDVTGTVGFGALTYTWKRYDADGNYIEDISGGGAKTYTLTASDIGKRIGVSVTAANAAGSVEAALTGVVAKAPQEAAAVPVLDSKTSSSISIVAAAGIEYSIDGGASWLSDDAAGGMATEDGQKDGKITFAGLTPKAAYTVTARKVETSVLAAGAVSAGLSVHTMRALYYRAEQTGGADATANSTGLKISFYSDSALSVPEVVTGFTTSNFTVDGAGVNLVSGTLASSEGGAVWTMSISGSFANGTAAAVKVLGLTDTEILTTEASASAQAVLFKDITAPALTPLSLNRSSDTAATINFETNEAGTAYYLQQEGGSQAPADGAAVKSAGQSLGSVGEGTAADRAVTLTAGLRDVFVTVVDAAGNAAAPIKFEAGLTSATLTKAPAGKSGLVYTGAARTLVDAGTASGGTLEYKVGEGGAWSTTLPKETNAGTYDVYYRIAGDAAHADASHPDWVVSVQVAAAASAVQSAPEALLPTYTGYAQALVSAGTASGGEMRYALDAGGPFDATVPTGTDAGPYSVYYYVAGDGNHEDTAVAGPVAVSMAKAAQASVTLSGELPSTFGESRTVTISGGSGTGSYTLVSAAPGIAEVTALNAAEGTFTVKIISSAGEYKLTYGRAADDNYKAITALSGGVDASKDEAQVTVTPTPRTLTYTGADQVLVNPGQGDGGTLKYWLWDGETDVASVPDSAFSLIPPMETNAGSYRVYYKVFGDLDHNNSAAGFATVQIAKAPATGWSTPAGITATYGDTLADVTLPDGWAWDDAFSTSVGGAGTQSFDATFTPADAANYNDVPGISVTVTVAKAAPTEVAAGGILPTVRFGDAVSTVDPDDFYDFSGVGADGLLTGTVSFLLPPAAFDDANAEAGLFKWQAVFTPTGAAAANYDSLTFTAEIPVLARLTDAANLASEVAAEAAVKSRIVSEDEVAGVHTGLSPEDYPAGVLDAFLAAYANAEAAAADSGATQKEIADAQAQLKAARAALVQAHGLVKDPVQGGSTFGGAASSGAGVVVTNTGAGDLTFEFAGHLPHVLSVTIEGPNHQTEETLWALNGGVMDTGSKPLTDSKLGRAAGTLTQGSAVVTLSKDYLALLSDGAHTITVTFSDPLSASGMAEGSIQFTIARSTAAGSGAVVTQSSGTSAGSGSGAAGIAGTSGTGAGKQARGDDTKTDAGVKDAADKAAGSAWFNTFMWVLAAVAVMGGGLLLLVVWKRREEEEHPEVRVR